MIGWCYHERLRLVGAHVENGTCFLKVLKKESIFWRDIVYPGGQC